MSTHIPAPWRKLPAQPNLEQLKKQSKDLLRRYLAGDSDAVDEVAKAERSPDPATFSLADAQRVLARAYGFSSWSTLKQHVDGMTVARFCQAAGTGNVKRLSQMIQEKPDLVHLDLAENDERRALHLAVMNRQADAVRILMDSGADAHKGVYPNRQATTAYRIAVDRDYTEIVQIIDRAEQQRRESASGPHAPVTNMQEDIGALIRAGNNDQAIAQISNTPALINARDRNGDSPLHTAAGALNDVMVEWLASNGADIRARDTAGRTPLDHAVFAVESRNKGSLERFRTIAATLRIAGAPLSLASAIALGESETVKDLHSRDASLFAPADLPVHPLAIAVRHRQIGMLGLLLDLGLDPNERRRLGNLEAEVYTSGEPLWHAVVGDDWDSAVLLLDRGANPNAQAYASGTPTTQAFGTRNVRMQNLLTEKGGLLPAEHVGLYRQTDVARRMLDGSLPVDVDKDSYSGPTLAEQLLWGAACGGDPEIVRLALQQIDWERSDVRWFRMAVEPLRIWNHGPGHWTGGYERSTYTSCFKQIIERCDVNIIGRQNTTLLHRAASDGSTWGQEVMTAEERTTFATILLQAGARFDIRDTILKSTPLAWAVRWGREEMVELLLQYGAPPIEPDAEPWAQPIAWAKRYGHETILRLLEVKEQ
jgi:ankyrin repeat protein